MRAETVDQAIGKPCARCQQIMLPGQPVQLDHDDDDPSRYIGYSHQSCNARAGAIAGNRARAAAYRAAKGLPPPPNGYRPAPPLERPACKRTREEIKAAAEWLPCVCGRLTSRCW